MPENGSGKYSLKENSFCCHCKNPGYSGKTESGRPFHGIQKRRKICSCPSGGRKELQPCTEVRGLELYGNIPELDNGQTGNGKYVSLRLGGLTWQDDLLNAQLEPGEYRIITSNRLPNGNMFAYVYYFSMAAGEKKEISLVLRQADLEDMLENIELPEFELRKDEAGTEKVKASELLRKEGIFLCSWKKAESYRTYSQ